MKWLSFPGTPALKNPEQWLSTTGQVAQPGAENPPVFNKAVVHVIGRPERPLAVMDYIIMVKMQIRSKINHFLILPFMFAKTLLSAHPRSLVFRHP